MGYRSDVRSFIRGKTKLVTALMVRARLEGNKAMELFEAHTNIEPNGKDTEIYLEIDDIKWYSDREDVRGWENLLDIAEDMQLEWEFIRSGEDLDDVDHRIGSDQGEYEFFVSKSILR
jgi:hypothetical protein